MKRIMLIILLTLSSFLSAYEMNLGGLGPYTIFDPDGREALLSYQKSWLRPSTELFTHDYNDSSSTSANWEQYLNLYGNSSNRVTVKYTPFSFPHRWSVGMQLTNLSTINPDKRSDAVLHYKNKRAELEYYNTNNTQIISMASGSSTKHTIKSNGLNFKYDLSDVLKLNGAIDINLIEQEDDSTRSYNIHHEQLAINYEPGNAFSVYGKFHYWYWVNDERSGPAMLFYPGMRYKKGIFMSHLSLRVSTSSIMPIAEIKLTPGIFNFHTYLKTRSSRLDLSQSANHYFGIKTGLNTESTKHHFTLALRGEYDFIPASSTDTVANHNFLCTKALAEYSLKIKNSELYTRGTYYYSLNPIAGFYHPEIAKLSAGLRFSTPLADNNLILKGDLGIEYYIHENPDNVSFDPITMTYYLMGNSDPVGDWKINFDLKAQVQTFQLSAVVSLPFSILGLSNNDYFARGFRNSTDLAYGHGAYAGLSIEWFWWK